MKKYLKQILVVLSMVFLVSCSSPKPALAESKTHTITVTETVHDTIFKIEKDSSSYQALLACQNGKVVVANVAQAEPGRSLKSPRVRIENNHLSVDCEARAQELLAHWKSKQVKEVQVKNITTTKWINQLTFWQKVQIWLGRIFLVLVVYYVFKVRMSNQFYRPF